MHINDKRSINLQEITEKEAEMSRLRLALQQYQDATKLMLDSEEMDGLSRPELASRYGNVNTCVNGPRKNYTCAALMRTARVFYCVPMQGLCLPRWPHDVKLKSI